MGLRGVRAVCLQTPGDFLVVDNAAVHGGFEDLTWILDYFQVSLMYLPAYSLNPCELVFP